MTSYFPRGVVARAPVWLWPAAAFALIAPESAVAPPGADPNTPTVLAGLAPEQVYVWGLRQETIGMATSASEGQVNFAESRTALCCARASLWKSCRVSR